jgi:hypothetical protein
MLGLVGLCGLTLGLFGSSKAASRAFSRSLTELGSDCPALALGLSVAVLRDTRKCYPLFQVSIWFLGLCTSELEQLGDRKSTHRSRLVANLWVISKNTRAAREANVC